MPLSADAPTVLWTLRNGHRRLECSVQLLPHGLELHLALNGDTLYCSRTFQAQDELLAWAEKPRSVRMVMHEKSHIFQKRQKTL